MIKPLNFFTCLFAGTMRASNGTLICVSLIGLIAVVFYMSSHFSNRTPAATSADMSASCAGVTWNASDDQRKYAYKYRAVTTYIIHST